MTLFTEVPWYTPIKLNPGGAMHVSWQSPSNIALVKYWGKYGQQLPANPSVSITLRQSVTKMELLAVPAKSGKGQLKNFYFDGQLNPGFAERFGKIIHSLHLEFSFLADFDLTIRSSNTFPHSAGIASSASGFSALALCICSLEKNLLQDEINEQQFMQRASYVSRLGSGSACRSIYGGFSAWGKTSEYPGSDDHYAIPLDKNIHPAFSDINDAILLISTSPKALSSSQGHNLMKDHPYRQARINQANTNILLLSDALRKGDWDSFIQVTESEALSLHALMMSSSPGFILMEPSTVEAIRRIQEYRKRSSIPLSFTMDAGPNVHLIYRRNDKHEISNFIRSELSTLCEDGQWIDDEAGTGPKRLK
jgi:diphosphomevalonate decarboxylase